MIKPIISPFHDAFASFGQSVTTHGFICSPYITYPPVLAFVRSLRERDLHTTVQVQILTDISLVNLIGGATDLDALLYLQQSLSHVSIMYLPRVHAKVYIADKKLAIVGSANWTEGGVKKNYEYGLSIEEPALVKQIYEDISGYASLGGEADASVLSLLRERIAPLKEAAKKQQRAFRESASAEVSEAEEAITDDLLRIRVGQRSVNSIFSDTLLFLLAQKPMTTSELNSRIEQIHPDLCDSQTDRIINGVHFGKKWKHLVRGAQVTLERRDLISYDKPTRLWRIT